MSGFWKFNLPLLVAYVVGATVLDLLTPGHLGPDVAMLLVALMLIANLIGIWEGESGESKWRWKRSSDDNEGDPSLKPCEKCGAPCVMHENGQQRTCVACGRHWFVPAGERPAVNESPGCIHPRFIKDVCILCGATDESSPDPEKS